MGGWRLEIGDWMWEIGDGRWAMVGGRCGSRWPWVGRCDRAGRGDGFDSQQVN
jgi:hypothetical protein